MATRSKFGELAKQNLSSCAGSRIPRPQLGGASRQFSYDLASGKMSTATAAQ